MLDSAGLRQDLIKTLIHEFEYPRLGAGMMWDKAHSEILRMGGQVLLGRRVIRLEQENQRISAVLTTTPIGEVERWPADQFIVSMPLRDCVLNMEAPLTDSVQGAARRLLYRDFLLVALIVNRTNLFRDQWLYIHDPTVKVGRIDNYNNWTSEMAPEEGKTCLVFEYFCSQNDPLWQQADEDLVTVARHEFEKLGFGKVEDVEDGCVVRTEKAYPIYDENYLGNVNIIRQALSKITNLQTVGRNGMHKYNNQDHSMLTGILAARNLMGDKKDVWCVNTESEYHEEENGVMRTGRQIPRHVAVKV